MEQTTKIILAVLNKSKLENISYLYETKSDFNYEGTVTVNQDEYDVLSPIMDTENENMKITCMDEIETKKGTLYTIYVYSNSQKIKESDLPIIY